MEAPLEIMESGYMPLLPKPARIRARLEQAISSSDSIAGCLVQRAPREKQMNQLFGLAA